MEDLRELRVILLVSYLVILGGGCVRFTDRDYELQKKAYERQAEQRELERNERAVIRW